jgi:hypothetical protein
MKTILKTEGAVTSFIITNLDPAYHEAMGELYYIPAEDGFAKSYPANTPHIDRIYRNFTRYAEEMILQTARVHPVPWDKALYTYLQIIENESLDWWLAGSAALSVRGFDVKPRDLDLVVDGASAGKLGELLIDYLVEPVLRSDDWIADWFGRAFIHARLEWIGDVHDNVDIPQVSDFGPAAERRLETVIWRGREIRVPPLDLQIQVSERRGLSERVEMIRSLLS